jgi:uncharacterized protein (DUF58 family)
MPEKRRSQKKGRMQGPTFTRRGWGFLAASCAGLLLGILLKEAPVVQLALFCLVALAAAWVVASFNLQRLRITRTTPKSVYAGHDFTVELQIHNDARLLPAFAIEVHDQMLHFADKDLLLTSVPPGNFCKVEARTRIVRRGYVVSEPCSIKSSFPFGLFVANRQDIASVRTRVYPDPETPRALKMMSEAEFMDGEMGYRPARDWTGELRGMRDFQPGDALKAIHWPASARSRHLVVRECDLPVAEKISIVFHSYFAPGQLVQAEAFEHSMKLLAGLLYYCQRRNAPLDLTTSFLDWKTFEIPDPQRLDPALALLAGAKQKLEESPDTLVRRLKALRGHHPLYILGDAGLDGWFQEIPALSRRVICLDNAGLRIRRPPLDFKRVRRIRAATPITYGMQK